MRISYKPLWRQLVEKNMSKMDLLYATGISACTLAKFGKNEPVRLDILMKVCETLDCRIENVVEFIHNV
ncbi:MAG: helix-turn-helix transcriptional regulator [Clostridia bacterium]|nr:helix-turn-helix transcriptional regulator [Clostridia bacterium]